MKRRSGAAATAGIQVKAGNHCCLMYSDPGQLTEAVEFLARGLAAGDLCVFLSYERLSERISAQLRDLHGVDLKDAQGAGDLTFLDGGESARELLAELQKVHARAQKAKEPMRLVTSFGFGEAGWPDDDEIAELDCRLTGFSADHSVSTLCLFDVRQLPGSTVLGALESHACVISRGVAHKNPLFVEASLLQAELRAKKRGGEERMRSWMG